MRVKKVLNIFFYIGVLGAFMLGCAQSYISEEEMSTQSETIISQEEEMSETIIGEKVENETTDIEENVYHQNDAYKIYYGIWEITGIVCEHSRLGGNDGCEDIIGWQVTYLPTVFECGGVSVENPNYLMTIFPADGSKSFIDDFIVTESILPNSDYFVWVQIVDKPSWSDLGIDYDEYGTEKYTGSQFFIKDDTTLYCVANNCIYELSRISYMDGYDVIDATTYHERM